MERQASQPAALDSCLNCVLFLFVRWFYRILIDYLKKFENKQSNSNNEGNTVSNNNIHRPNKRNTNSIHNLSRTNNNGYKHISKHHRNRLNNKINRIVNRVLDPPTYITNLSSKTLTAEQNKILTLGMKYVPSTRCKPPAILEAVLL